MTTPSITPLRIVFLGQNGIFSLAPLRAIAEHHVIVGVAESAPRGSRRLTWRIWRFFQGLSRHSGLRRFAWQKRIPFFYLTKERVHAFAGFLKSLNPDLLCMASVSQILPTEILRIPRLGVLNVHPSLLPRYRGPNPLFWQLYEMDSEGGVTIHFADEGEDTGDIVLQQSFAIPADMDGRQMIARVSALGADLLRQALDAIAEGSVVRRRQSHLPCPLRARNLRPNESLIAWDDWPLERVFRVLRNTRSWNHELERRVPASLFWEWDVVEAISGVPDGPPGSFAQDRNGYYLNHREGKIRLTRRFSPIPFLRRFLL